MSLMSKRANSRTRTDDRLITNQLLYQLSYVGGNCLRSGFKSYRSWRLRSQSILLAWRCPKIVFELKIGWFGKNAD